jgi:outer membrane immunogenic protein
MLHRLSIAAVSTIAFAQIAIAADLPVKAPAAVVAPSAYSWTGFYVGLNLGGSWGHQSGSIVDSTGATLANAGKNLDGVIGGGQIGYNWQVNQWVFGLEADFQGSGQKFSDTSGFVIVPTGALVAALPPVNVTNTLSDKLNWFGTVRGRLGWAFDRWMPYFTGGWAYGHGEINDTLTVGATAISPFNSSHNYTGWTIGGGVEWAFANNWSAKLEYLYIDFGNGPSVPIAGTTFAINVGRMTDNIARAGVNYKF